MDRETPSKHAPGLTRRTFVTGAVAGSALYGIGTSWNVGAYNPPERH